MLKSNDSVLVMFRKYGPRKGGEVIALFPCEAWSDDPYTCACYVHVGQHGSCDPRLVIAQTRVATSQEYTALKRELSSAPYDYHLIVYQRTPNDALKKRKAQIAARR